MAMNLSGSRPYTDVFHHREGLLPGQMVAGPKSLDPETRKWAVEVAARVSKPGELLETAKQILEFIDGKEKL
jgi:hypothetical protein